MPRPRKGIQRRDKTLNLRVSNSEKARLSYQAKQAGLSMTDYILKNANILESKSA